MKTLFKKELQYYLNNPVGYIVIVIFSATINFLYVKDIFVVGVASMKQFFSLLPWVLLFFLPALSMRLFSEEKRAHTLEVLLTLPVTETQIVFSKFLALLTIVATSLLLTCALPFYLALTTKLYLPEVIVGYFGIILFSSLLLSLSLFCSLKTNNQIVAFLISLFIIFVLLGLSSELFSSLIPAPISSVMPFFLPLSHLQNFLKGVIDMRSVIYFLSSTLLLLIITIFDLEKRI